MYNVDSQMKTKLLCSSWYHWIHFKQKTAVTNTVIAEDWIFHSFTTAFKKILPISIPLFLAYIHSQSYRYPTSVKNATSVQLHI